MTEKWKPEEPYWYLLWDADGAPSEVRELLYKRAAFRHSRHFKEADEVREQVEALGWRIEDVPKGFRLRKIM